MGNDREQSCRIAGSADRMADRPASGSRLYSGVILIGAAHCPGVAGLGDLPGLTAGLFVGVLATLVSVVCLVREVRRRRRVESALCEATQRLERVLAGTETNISERKQAEDALRASERRERDRAAELATLLDAVPMPVFVSRDPDCLHITGNRAADELLRNSRGGEVSLGAPPDIRPKHYRVFAGGRELAVEELPAQRAARGQRVEGAELRLVFDDGTLRDVIGYAMPLQDAEGQPRGAIVALTDITEHKRTEAALERTRDTFAEAQEIAHLGSFEYLVATGTTIWSEEEYRIYGLDPTGPSPAYDVLLAQYIHPDDAALLQETLGKAMQSGGVYELEHRIVRPDGSVRWVYNRARPFLDEDGKLFRYVGATLDITDRKLAEAALRAGEELNRSTLQALPAHIAVLDGSGHIIATNQAWDEFAAQNQAGGQPSVMVGANYLEVCRQAAADDDESAAEALAGIEAVMTGRAAQFTMECQCHSPSEQRWYLMTVVPLGKPGTGGAVVTHLDITKRKQAETSLRQSREDLDRAEAVGQIGWWRLDTVRNVLTWSDENHRIFGIPKGTPLTYETFLSSVHPDDRAEVDARWMAGLRGAPYEFEHRIVAQGKVKWVREKAYLEFDSKGTLLGGFGITQDITIRKQVEEALRESHARLKKVVAVETVGVMFWDLGTGCLVDANDAFLKMMGYSRSDVEARNLTWQTFTPPEYHEVSLAEVRKFRATGRVGPYEKEYFRKDGTRQWLLFAGSSLGDDACVEFCIDISDRKAAEAALRASLQEKEVLLKEIHHRVKNNMQVISSIVSLQADRTSDHAIRAVLQDVIYRVRSMALVHEKLYQSADFACVQFAEYAESLLHYIWRAQGSAAAGIRLTLDLHPVLLSVNEAVPFGLILNELASNALKHAFRDGNGSEVAVSLRSDPKGRVCLRVRDNGQGLPAGVDWRMAKSLGLKLVQILAKQLHADVEAVSGDGTEFAVTFRVAKP